MRFYFEEAALWETQRQRVFDEINQMGLPLVLFGRSKNTHPSILEKIQVPVQYVCSNNPNSWGTEFWGMEVISPSKMQELYQNYVVLILASEKKNEILLQLQKLPTPPAKIFRIDLHRNVADQHTPVDTAAYFKKMKMETEQVYDRLADQESKDIYEAVIRYRMTRNLSNLEPFVSPIEEQYFPASLDGKPFLGSDEVFVDVGAYIGDTVQNFLSFTSGKNGEKCPGGGYKHIYAIEPEQKNYQVLLESVQSQKHITCLKYGVGDTAQKLYVSSAGDGSKIVEEESNECIQVDTLDHLLDNVPVTYIKMDIEGMECPALDGAKKLVQKYRPKLACSCYHSDSDMIMVPKKIISLDPSYRLYIRHYTCSLFETVCYAL